MSNLVGEMMNVLVIGGTRFVGRHLVDSALARGWSVTLFHRGNHANPFGDRVSVILGDRHGDLSAVSERRWDAVIDTCCFFPSSLEMMLDALTHDGQTPHYTVISSVSVYDVCDRAGLDESDESTVESHGLADRTEDIERLNQSRDLKDEAFGAHYGILKLRCEQAAHARAPSGGVLVVRPGIVVGPWDYTERFTYWPDRFARGGQVLAPGSPERFVQWIDARDLAEWTVEMVGQRVGGVFNATGPQDTWTMGMLMDACVKATDANAEVVWVEDEVVLAHDVQPWVDLPLWLPEQLEHMRGLMRISTTKAHTHGLICRDVGATVRDTLAWSKANQDRDMSADVTLSSEREEQVLGHDSDLGV